MAKFFGKIGYSIPTEDAPGVWTGKVIERPYRGDILRENSRYDSGQKVNDDIRLSNRFSIVADPYALENFSFIRYIIYMGVKWEVTSIDVKYPRLELNVGGVYNG